MSAGAINSSWIRLHPTGRMDAAYWLEVLAEMAIAEVDASIATIDEIKAAMTAVEMRLTDRMTAARALRDQARALSDKARLIESEPMPSRAAFRGLVKP